MADFVEVTRVDNQGTFYVSKYHIVIMANGIDNLTHLTLTKSLFDEGNNVTVRGSVEELLEKFEQE